MSRGMPVTDRRHETSQSEYHPGGGFGDIGVGGKVIGVAGFDLPSGDPADGDVAVWDAATSAWVWVNSADLGTPLDVQEDGVDVVNPATVLNAGHGLDVTDEGGGVAGLAVDETELNGALIPGIAAGLGLFIPENYGAVGDGIADDTAAMNAMIAALNAAGKGQVYSPGFYKCTGALTPITAVGVWEADGKTGSYDGATLNPSRLICTSGTATFLTVGAGFSVRNLALINSAGSVTAGYGLGGTDMNLCSFEGLSIIGFWINAAIDGGLWSMRNCYIRQSHKYGIKITYAAAPDGGDWNITDCYLTDGANSSDAAIRMESGGGGKIIGTKINGNSSGFAYGIDVALPNGVVTSDLQITGCSIENFRTDGIRIVTASGATFGHVTIVGNQIAPDLSFNSTGNCVTLAANAAGDLSGIQIVGNVMAPNGGGTSSGSGVSLTKVDRILVTNNIYSSPYGMYTAGLTQSGCTNVLEYSGGIGAGVSITGTPSAGQVPIASSGTAAAWGTISTAPTTAQVRDAGRWDAVVDGGTDTLVFDNHTVVYEWITDVS